MKIEIPVDFTPYQCKLVEQIITNAVQHIQTILPLLDVTFKVILDDNQAIPQYGVGGYAPDSNNIELALSPGRESDWTTYLPSTIAHEWHHVARWRGPGYGDTLAETIISEGLAQHFEADCYPGTINFFSIFLKDEERKLILDAFIQNFKSSEYDWSIHAKWFFGKGEFPFLAGYDLSFYVIGKYLEMKKSTASNEVGLTPEQLALILPNLQL